MGRPVLVGIPYLARGAQGRELEYAVAGWRRHFREHFVLAVVGDHHPVADRYGDVVHIPAPRVAPMEGEYLPAIDIVHKMLQLHCAFPEHDSFIWSADDIYAVNDFTLEDVSVLKMLEPTMDGFSLTAKNPWCRMMARTRQTLEANGCTTRNYATHLPCLYECDRLLDVIRMFGLTRTSLSVQTLYFNIEFRNTEPFRLRRDDRYKLGVYTRRPDYQEVKDAFRTKIWINNSVIGYSPRLETMLARHYGL